MNLFDKILHPFDNKDNYKKEYKDLSKDSQRVGQTPPSDLLLYCRNLAGVNIQNYINSKKNARWIRAEYTYPAFDSMNFSCGNQIFSVIIDIQDETGKSYLPEDYVKRQLYASKEYNLIPCRFPVTLPDPLEPDADKIKQLSEGLNLFHTQTGEEIYPENYINKEKIELSQWEMRNIGIKFILNYLKVKGYKIISYQDTLEVDPQIWFKNNDDKKYWVILRSDNKFNSTDLKPEKIDEIIRRCFKYDGYYAEIIFEPKENSDKRIYRGDEFKINFKGLEKIHSTI